MNPFKCLVRLFSSTKKEDVLMVQHTAVDHIFETLDRANRNQQTKVVVAYTTFFQSIITELENDLASADYTFLSHTHGDVLFSKEIDISGMKCSYHAKSAGTVTDNGVESYSLLFDLVIHYEPFKEIVGDTVPSLKQNDFRSRYDGILTGVIRDHTAKTMTMGWKYNRKDKTRNT